MSDTAPPGWYPDPTAPGTQRYWDGQAWTDHHAPLAGPAATPPSGLPALASFGQRLGAAVVDGLVFAVPMTLIMVALFLLLALTTGGLLEGLDGSGPGAAGGLLIGGFAVFAVVLLAAIVAPILYGIGFEGSPRGQTIGKWMVGIRVVDGTTAGRLPISRAAVRVLVRSFASGALFALGYLWMLWDEQNRTWHDMAADSRVVVAEGPRPGFRELLRTWTLRA